MSDLSYLVAKHRQNKFDYYKNQEEMQTRRRIIEELEKIKAEIRNLFEVEVEETGFVYERVNVYCDDVIEILDKKISELKGEQE